jgi:NAD(P)-dependent dehydrogenase (short-subunit alcohol dehydrogenase family)
MFDLTGQVAVVTGGNRGIGLGFAIGLAKAGASVSVWGRNPQRNHDAMALIGEAGGTAHSVACDVTDETQVQEATATTLEYFGRIDSLFANAHEVAPIGAVAAKILSPERSTGPRVNRSTGPESGLGLVDLSTC